ncbi:MAG: Lrp/AsnC family leucine-responsive transcriptional regulator [Planctomycetota bacterium]|jgi:Lrp/AsnC family leucine-responsive transcriptional regulator
MASPLYFSLLECSIVAKKTTISAKLDDIDLRILSELSDQGRISNTSLSREVGLSESATLERVRRLEKSGIILGYSARVVPEALGLGAMAIVHMKLVEHAENQQQAINALVSSKHVISCDRVLGSFDIAIKIGASSLQELESLINLELRQIDGVEVVESMLVTTTAKD